MTRRPSPVYVLLTCPLDPPSLLYIHKGRVLRQSAGLNPPADPTPQLITTLDCSRPHNYTCPAPTKNLNYHAGSAPPSASSQLHPLQTKKARLPPILWPLPFGK